MAAGAAVTTVGKGLAATALVAGNVALYVAHGIGTTTPAVTDTGLETARDLDTASAWAGTNSVSVSVKYRVTHTMACGSALSITEVGLFKEAAMTNMFYHEVFAAISVTSGDTIAYTIDITVG